MRHRRQPARDRAANAQSIACTGLSFSVYLFHTIPLTALNRFLPGMFTLPAPWRLAYTVGAIVLTYLAAAALTTYWDWPLNRRRAEFLLRRQLPDNMTTG
ncbi:hypothetical protein [Ralstonia soli]|uniref:Acyltransferase 3 domain-containing protein n=1 Tax=Ralstonia soli TaxID=2953896 RepID=A0ABT1AH21_9RALS|nr:hypothetical protein [Ralstonia soli]MCO5397482.1 hypothetical protein [Ralstonia soli]